MGIFDMIDKSRPHVREITADAANDVLLQLVDGELVHPLGSGDENPLKQLLARLCPSQDEGHYEKHCFGLYAANADTPSAVVYVKLLKLPTEKGVVPDHALPGDITQVLHGQNRPLSLFDIPNTAIFYSISTLKKFGDALPEGMGAGEFLIKQTAAQLHEHYGVTKFSTLSPLRQKGKGGQITGFRAWLEQELATPARAPHFTQAETATIDRIAAATGYGNGTDTSETFFSLITHQPALDGNQREAVQGILRMLALKYLVALPQQRGAVDPVEKFHMGNGAMIGNVHVKSPEDTTALEWQHAFGVMVNYVYDLDKPIIHGRAVDRIETRKTAFASDATNRVAVNGALMAQYRMRESTLQREAGFVQRVRVEAPKLRAL